MQKIQEPKACSETHDQNNVIAEFQLGTFTTTITGLYMH